MRIHSLTIRPLVCKRFDTQEIDLSSTLDEEVTICESAQRYPPHQPRASDQLSCARDDLAPTRHLRAHRTNGVTPPVRVALIAGQLGLGGSEQQLYYSLLWLDRSRFSPIVISLGPHADEYWSDPIRQLGIPLWHVHRSLGRAGRLLRITRILRSQNIQLVHSWVFHANIYAAAAGRFGRRSAPARLDA